MEEFGFLDLKPKQDRRCQRCQRFRCNAKLTLLIFTFITVLTILTLNTVFYYYPMIYYRDEILAIVHEMEETKNSIKDLSKFSKEIESVLSSLKKIICKISPLDCL